MHCTIYKRTVYKGAKSTRRTEREEVEKGFSCYSVTWLWIRIANVYDLANYILCELAEERGQMAKYLPNNANLNLSNSISDISAKRRLLLHTCYCFSSLLVISSFWWDWPEIFTWPGSIGCNPISEHWRVSRPSQDLQYRDCVTTAFSLSVFLIVTAGAGPRR